MPELPEVEIAKRSLSNHILNKKILDVTIINPKLRYFLKKKDFTKIINKTVNAVERVSKYILLKFADQSVVLIHLGMTGRLYFKSKNSNNKDTSFYSKQSILKKHDHVLFKFKNFNLIYNDIRKFGFIKYYNFLDSKNISHLNGLGPEPLSKNFSKDYFLKKLKNKKAPIKNTLMDQRFVAGLGNIYVNEALFLSKISPKKLSFKLNSKEITNLIHSIKKIIKKSIKMGGSTIKNYHNSDGRQGSYQAEFKIYGRQGQKCIRRACKGVIRRNMSSNRSFFFCPICQRI